MRILLAEDDDMSRLMLQRDLQKMGYDVVAARDGHEAWELFNQQRAPIIVTDWMMPRMDGLELIRRVREAGADEYVYAILLTSRSENTDLVDGMDAGADDFITKPFAADELRVRLRAGRRIIDLEQTLRLRKQELEQANGRMQSDLQAAARIQRTCLPSRALDIPGVRVAWDYRPCDELAGDMLNVVQIDDTRVGFYLLDVSGHGVPSALLSVALSRLMTPDPSAASVLREAQADPPGYRVLPPSEVASRLNRRLLRDSEAGQYSTLLYGVVDTTAATCTLVSAGHPPSVLIEPGHPPRMLDLTGFPLGLTDLSLTRAYQELVVPLTSGTRLYLYSDGITEAHNREADEFGCARLLQALEESRHLPLEESVQHLLGRLHQWLDGSRLDDDTSMLALEYV